MAINQKPERPYFIDKLGFLVGYAALCLALFSFKDELNSIIIPILLFNTTALQIVVVFVILLFIAIFIHSLFYIGLENIFLSRIGASKYLVYISEIIYVIVVAYYPLIAMLYFATMAFYKVSEMDIVLLTIINGILAICSSICMICIIFKSVKTRFIKEKNITDEINNLRKSELEDAELLLNRGDFEMMIIKSYNALVNTIKNRTARKYGTLITNTNPLALINLAKQDNIININDFNYINRIRILRNNIAHKSNIEDLNKNVASNILDNIKRLVNLIDSPS